MFFWAGSGSEDLWGVEVRYNTDRVIYDSQGQILPCFRIFVKPPFGVGGDPRDIVKIDRIPEGYEVGYLGATGFWSGGVSGQYVEYYLYYDPYNDVIYKPRAATASGVGSSNVLTNYFVNSWAYKSFEFVRNSPSVIVDSSPLLSSISNKLKWWLIIGVGIALAYLIVRYGYVFILRFLFPVALIGAINRVGRNKND